MKPALVSFLLASCAIFSGCPEHGKAVAVTVLLVGNGTAYHAVSPRFMALGKQTLRSPSGRSVVVLGVYVRADDMQRYVEKIRPVDIVVCDSPEQLVSLPALNAEAAKAVNVGGSGANCPAGV